MTKAVKRRGFWWLGRAALVLIVIALLTLLVIGVLWQQQQQSIARQIHAQLRHDPIVRGHLGDTLIITGTSPPSAEAHQQNTLAFAVTGSLGNGVVIGRLLKAADGVRIDKGRLHMPSGLNYPLDTLGDEPTAAAPMAMRLEYIAPAMDSERTGAPDLIVSLDADNAVTDSDLMSFVRSRLVTALASVDGVAVIWSLRDPRQTSVPIMLMSVDTVAMKKAGVDPGEIPQALEAAGFVAVGDGRGFYGFPTMAGDAHLITSIVVRGDHADVHLSEIIHVSRTMQRSRVALGVVLRGDSLDTIAAAVRRSLAAIAMPAGIHLRGGYRFYLRLDQSPAQTAPSLYN